MDTRKQLDDLIKNTETYNKNALPQALVQNLNNWKWGSYGWTSPASLFLTAAWHKYCFPNYDCCKIWAKDERNNPIPGSYSIRSEDESITVPLLAKYELCLGFCSANSGMQGSRAIEKMRSLKRLNTDFDQTQRTFFDLKLFATILNQINTLNQEQCLEFCRYFILIAKNIRKNRISENEKLVRESHHNISSYDFLCDVHDPELTKCVTAACLIIIYNNSNLSIQGVSDAKTAADARAKKPGDLCLYYKDLPIIAIEVKDKTQEIDWNNIERACRIIRRFSSLRNFMFVLEKRDAIATPLINEMVSSNKLKEDIDAKKISFTSLHDLYLMALSLATDQEISNLTSKLIAQTPTIKPETIKKWLIQK